MCGDPGIPLFAPSGAGAHLRGLARALARRAPLDLLVAAPADGRGSVGEAPPARFVGIPPWPSPLGRWRELRERWLSHRLHRAIEQDLVGLSLLIERASLYCDAGMRLHQEHGIPWLLEVNAPLAVERARSGSLAFPRFAHNFERSVLRAAPLVVAVSQALTHQLRSEFGLRNVHWVPNGSDLPPGDRSRGRARLGLSDDEPILGFVGAVRPWHGLERLPSLARALGARLLVVGAGPHPEGAIGVNWAEGTELADLIAAMDVGLAPHPAEAPDHFCPLKILDYRSQGTPVLASDLGDAAVLTEGGGLVVPAGDDVALRTAALHLLGIRFSPARRTWDHVAARLLALAGIGPSPGVGLWDQPSSPRPVESR